MIQTLAGGPLVVERHEHPRTNRDRYAKAILTAAIDARRLGDDSPFTTEFLHEAASAYLDETDRVDTPHNWFRQGLDCATHDPAHRITALIPMYQEVHVARRRELTSTALWNALLAACTGTLRLCIDAPTPRWA